MAGLPVFRHLLDRKNAIFPNDGGKNILNNSLKDTREKPARQGPDSPFCQRPVICFHPVSVAFSGLFSPEFFLCRPEWGSLTTLDHAGLTDNHRRGSPVHSRQPFAFFPAIPVESTRHPSSTGSILSRSGIH
jgi:hypothetical protein